MQKTTSRKNGAKTNETVQGDVDNVDKIRDILFGNQMRDFERKFVQMEQRISEDIASLRKETSMQIESLQSYVDSEVAILAGKLKNSEADAHQQMDKLAAEMQQNHQQAEKKIAAVSNALDEQGRDINQKMLKQAKDFQDEMNKQLELVKKRLEQYREDLSGGKVDKSTLAEMLNTLALQVQGEDTQ